ncbi:MAG: sugar ABC transporter substrate-binding protein [Lactobacillus sp.]|jgi:multiple sugar transport system substrate-binding protein|nr:sugar ABC transporter substrate-binding protein [Lactobacillus sp.]
MMKRHSWLAVLGGVAVAALVLAGCGNKSADNKNAVTTIRFTDFSASPDHTKDLKAMIAGFEKENPKIKVDLEQLSYDDYFTKLQTQMAGGNAPDVFELNYENFENYAKKGTLADLSSYVKKDKDFNKNEINKQAYDAFSYNGKQYGMVESFSNVALFYNKDLFKKYGVETPKADWTWKDEQAAAKKLTRKVDGKQIWGTYAPVTMNEFYKVAAQNGGTIFNKDGKPTMNSSANKEALQYMVDNVLKYKVSPSPAEMSGQKSEDLFKNGQLAMVHTGIWEFSDFAKTNFKWDIQVEPGNTQKATHFFANGFAVYNKSDKKEAAYKFARYMSASKKVANIRIKSSWELPALSSKSILKPYLEQTPPASRDVVFKSLNYLTLPPVASGFSKMSDATDSEFEKVLNKSVSPTAALDSLQTQFKQIQSKE